MAVNYEDVRAQLSWMCAAMIPGDTTLGMPSASDVDVINLHLPRALKGRPDLSPQFLATVSSLPAAAPADPIAMIKAISAAQLEVIGRFIAGAYFSAKEVSTALRFPGFEALYEDVDYDEIMEAIEPIMARGPCYIQI